MTMRVFATYAATLVSFVALDAAWLSLFAIDMFQREIGGILRAQPYLSAVGVLYLIFASALTGLAVWPAAEQGAARGAVWRGALLGVCAYATYDLTNYATLKGYTLALALKDLAWGTFASAAASVTGCWVALRLRSR